MDQGGLDLRTPTRAAARAMFLLLAASLLPPDGLRAQEIDGADEAPAAVPVSTVGGIAIDGPPPPVAPEVVSRDETGGATVRAVRVETPLTIDGRLDEPFYRDTPPITDFLQTVPVEAGEPTQRTEAWIGFDDTHVYVSARIWDEQGEDGWIANEMRRDSNQLRQNDNFGVFFDTFYDRRNALAFYVTPIGGFADFQITNEGSPNFDWNPVWDVRTDRFDGGWTVEMAIPFKSLRYRPGTDQVWGLQFRRSVLRRSEWNHLTHIPFSAAGNGSQAIFRVSLYGTLVGIEAPPPARNLEFKPYATSGIRTDLGATPAIENDAYADAGFEIKYGVTQNLTADFTFRTDFAQVEVDEQQVNLTRFSLTFPEKRDFFLEGRGIFNFATSGFGGGGGGGGGSAPNLFYSRRIGIQGGDPVQVLGGARLTGKVGPFDVGALSIQTGSDADIGAGSTNFTVLRLRRDVFARSSVGVLFGNRSQSVAQPDRSNQTMGVDGTFGIGTDANIVTYYAETRTPDAPGDERSYRARFNYDPDLYGIGADHLFVGDAFNPEIGLVRRRGFSQSSLSARYSPRPASVEWIRQLSLQGNLAYLENEPGGFLESRDRGGQLQIELENGDDFTASFSESYERLVQPERIAGTTMPAGQYRFQDYRVSYRFGSQRPYQGNASVRWGGFFGGDRLSVGLSQGRAELTPQLSLEPSLELNFLELPVEGEMVRFDQHVVRNRITYTFTPRAYISGLVQYNRGSNSFSGNFRLRWEWAPGSELFIVYTEDRDTDALDRWSQLSNRGLVIKVTRLFQL